MMKHDQQTNLLVRVGDGAGNGNVLASHEHATHRACHSERSEESQSIPWTLRRDWRANEEPEILRGAQDDKNVSGGMNRDSQRPTMSVAGSCGRRRLAGALPVRCRGFTLVEVSLAMAVGTFALISLLAMAMLGMRMGRLAVDDTVSGTVAQDLFAEWRMKDFAAATNDVRYYDKEGVPNATGSAQYYKCAVLTYDAVPSNYVKTVELVFVWPNVNSFASSPNTNRYFTRIARTDNPN
jgi:uncharacterized protein (TIGR02598 family)